MANVIDLRAEPAPSEEEEDEPFSSAEKAAYGGILRDVCKYVSFTELKHMRQVCRTWCDLVSTLPRILNCTGKFGSAWRHEVSGMNYEECIKFRSIYFRFFPFKRNTVIDSYLDMIGRQNLTRLKFKFTKISCQEMVQFLQACPNLHEVCFHQCNFKLEVYDTEITEQNTPIVYKTCCTHIDGLDYISAADLNIPPRIRSIKFKAQNFFPLCVLDLLIQRSRGVLQTFEHSDSFFADAKRRLFRPTVDVMNARLVTLISNSSQRISSFTLNRVFGGYKLLAGLNRLGIRLPNLLEINLGQKEAKYFWGLPFGDLEFLLYLEFLQVCCGTRLRSIEVRLESCLVSGLWADALTDKTELRRLRLDGIALRPGQVALNINHIISRCPHLEDLEIWDRNRRRRPCMTTDYLETLPRILKRLNFHGRYIPIADVDNYIRSPFARILKSLTIEWGVDFTNAMMQTVITELPQLEEFGLNRSKITDAALTGLTEQAVTRMSNCTSGIMYTQPIDETALVGRKISEMKKLRKLSFCMTTQVSDISIFLAFKFPELREINLSWCLNVTDVGLYWLAKNNPALERIVLMKNRKISHYELNKLVMEFPTLKNIHTSRSCRCRRFEGQLNYLEHPRFRKIVSYAKWDEKRPAEYGDY